ncbi:hypothetical protein BDZ97DRAFT_2012375 [Flammula alnicola]|nr:hypothetical protein BDZ97DRAFT_2012375 [Flammula alnicola]
MSSNAQPVLPDLSPIAGPQLIGYILNWGLYGVLSMQVYLYYLAFPNDRPRTKALVYGAFLLESTQSFLFMSSAFRSFAKGFGNPQVLDQVDILWFSVPIMSGMVAFIGQSFYAYRISVLAQTKYIAAIIMLFAFIQLAAAIAIGIQTKQAVLFSHFLKTNSFVTAGIAGGASAACDIIIAISMTYYLRRGDTGIKETQVLVSRIIRLTIETGTLTAAITIVGLILTVLPGRTTYYQTSVGVVAKVYSNSMMVVFNSRMRISCVDSSSTAHEVPLPLSFMKPTSDNGTSSRNEGILVTREEVSFPPTSYDPKEITDCHMNGRNTAMEMRHRERGNGGRLHMRSARCIGIGDIDDARIPLVGFSPNARLLTSLQKPMKDRFIRKCGKVGKSLDEDKGGHKNDEE